MQITNLTADVYDLPGLRVHAGETVSFNVARYTGDDHFRLEVNTLYGNGKISVASVPPGFPIATSFEAEIARGEAPGVSASGSSAEVVLGAPGNFDIAVTPNVVNQGAVSFHAVNSDGAAIAHEFLLIKTAMTAAAWIAAAPIGGAVDESGLDIRIDTGDIRQGGDSSAVVTLEPGHYLAVCNEPGHSHNGMAVDFTVDATPGGSLPSQWTADAQGNLLITPDSSVWDPEAILEGTPPIKFIAPALYAFYLASTNTGRFVVRALTVGASGNSITVDLVLDGGATDITVDVVGTTITFTCPNGTTYGEVVAAGQASPSAAALATFYTTNAADPMDSPGSFPFAGGFDAGPYIEMRLSGNEGGSWFINADGGIDIQSADGDFIAQIDRGQGGYFRQPVGGYAGITVVDSDFNEIVRADANGVGFNGHNPSVPVVASMPDAQAVVDALLTLGLVTQAT